MEALSQSDALDKLREQTRAEQHAARDTAEPLLEIVRTAAARETNPLLKLDMERLRELGERHAPGSGNVNKWENPFPASNPKNALLQYQFEYWHDAARFKAWLASRQIGKDFSSEGEAAENCFTTPGTRWLIAAPSERQSLDSLEQQKLWAEAFGLALADYDEQREGAHGETLLKSASILYSNKSQSEAVPGRPDTVRGKSASVLLTEFDFFEAPAETWRAILPSITNPLRGGEKKARIISTGNGKGRMMDKIFNGETTLKWSRHLTSIWHAVLMGLPVDVAELRAALDDPDGFAQEYECAFLDGSNTLLPYDVIANAESFEASEAWEWPHGGGPLFCGIDFGRTNDPTVCWTLQKEGDVFWTREVLVLDNTPTPEQERVLTSRIARASRACLDYTGPGIGLGDYLAATHGIHAPDKHSFGKMELVTFTANNKREMFPRMRRLFEAPTKLRIPVSRAIREDLHLMQQTIVNGVYSYTSKRTQAGHSDRCTALALAVKAAGNGSAAPTTFSRVARQRRGALGTLRRALGL